MKFIWILPIIFYNSDLITSISVEQNFLIFNAKINELSDTLQCHITNYFYRTYEFSHRNSEHWLYAPTEKKIEFEHIGKPTFFLHLTDDLKEQGSNVSVLFGNFYNRQMLLYHNNVKITMEDIFSGGQLSDTEFIGFWVNWSHDKFEFGKKGNSTPFLSWQNDSPFEVKYIRIKSFNNTGIWRFKDIIPIENQLQNYGQLARLKCLKSLKKPMEADIYQTWKRNAEINIHLLKDNLSMMKWLLVHFKENGLTSSDYIDFKLKELDHLYDQSKSIDEKLTNFEIQEIFLEVILKEYINTNIFEQIQKAYFDYELALLQGKSD